MNKFFIALLIIAVAAGTYFLVFRKNEDPVASRFDKELLTGKWTQAGPDSSITSFEFDFQEKNLLIRSVEKDNAVKADSLYYEWTKEDDLLVKSSGKDTSSGFFRVFQLTKDSLYVKGGDSTAMVFTKVK
jgi:hypothetical protein